MGSGYLSRSSNVKIQLLNIDKIKVLTIIPIELVI